MEFDFQLGNFGYVWISRLNQKKLKLSFFDKNKDPLNIIKEYPDRFWQSDFYTSRIIKTIDNVYELENGVSKNVYLNLTKELNESPIPEFEDKQYDENPEDFTYINGCVDYVLEDEEGLLRNFMYGFCIKNNDPKVPKDLKYKFILIDQEFNIHESYNVLFKEDKWLLKTIPLINEFRWNLKDLYGSPENYEVDPIYLFLILKSILDHYMDFEDDQDDNTSFFALWIMGTYVFRVFNTYPYIYIGGFHGSGKTKLMDIMRMTCFNAMQSGNITPSSMFRLVEMTRCTLLVDENESLRYIDKRDVTAKDFKAMLNSGYKKGSKVYRTEKNVAEGYDVHGYDLYSPKIIANISGIDDILESRCISFIMRKTLTSKGDKEINEFDSLWQKIRNMLYRFGLNYATKIARIYDNIKESHEKTKNRDWELWKPFVTISTFLDDLHKSCHYAKLPLTYTDIGIMKEERLNIEDYAINPVPLTRVYRNFINIYIEKKLTEAYAHKEDESKDHKLASAVVDLYNKESIEVCATDVKTILVNNYDFNKDRTSTQWIGRGLTKLGLEKGDRVGNKRYYKLTKIIIDRVVDRYNLSLITHTPLHTNKWQNGINGKTKLTEWQTALYHSIQEIAHENLNKCATYNDLYLKHVNVEYTPQDLKLDLDTLLSHNLIEELDLNKYKIINSLSHPEKEEST